MSEQVEYFYLLTVEWNDIGALRRRTFTDVIYEPADASQMDLYFAATKDAEERSERYEVYDGKPAPRMVDATVIFWTCVPNRPPREGIQLV
jgi:hypothetical protein